MSDRFRHDVTAMVVAKVAVIVLFVGWVMGAFAADHGHVSVVTWGMIGTVVVAFVAFVVAWSRDLQRVAVSAYLTLAAAYGVGLFFYVYEFVRLSVGSFDLIDASRALIACGIMLALTGLAVNEARDDARA